MGGGSGDARPIAGPGRAAPPSLTAERCDRRGREWAGLRGRHFRDRPACGAAQDPLPGGCHSRSPESARLHPRPRRLPAPLSPHGPAAPRPPPLPRPRPGSATASPRGTISAQAPQVAAPRWGPRGSTVAGVAKATAPGGEPRPEPAGPPPPRRYGDGSRHRLATPPSPSDDASRAERTPLLRHTRLHGGAWPSQTSPAMLMVANETVSVERLRPFS